MNLNYYMCTGEDPTVDFYKQKKFSDITEISAYEVQVNLMFAILESLE